MRQPRLRRSADASQALLGEPQARWSMSVVGARNGVRRANPVLLAEVVWRSCLGGFARSRDKSVSPSCFVIVLSSVHPCKKVRYAFRARVTDAPP